MRVCSTGSIPLVNAEVDSMGGIVDRGDGVLTEPSTLCKSIEKAQTELRQEYDVREERRRELEFLEKGGNPLDFKFRNAASVSVQSTSPTDQHPKQIVTSEAKGSFALAASPHGDSIESSGRPGGALSVCEPNTADNLMLFDGKNQFRKNGIQNAKKLGDSADFGTTRQAYTRRNRSRPNRDVARSISTVDLISSQKRSLIDSEKQNDCKISSKLNKNVLEAPIYMASGKLDCVGGKEQVNNKVISGKNNGFKSSKRDKRSTSNGLDSDSSCTQISVSLDGKNGSEMCTTLKNINSDSNAEGDKSVKENNESKGDGNFCVTNDNCGIIHKSHEKDSRVARLEEELEKNGPGLKNDVNDPSTFGGMDQETERKASNLLSSNIGENVCSNEEFFESKVSIRVSTVDPHRQNCSGNSLKLDDKAHQDSILEEARVIEAKHKRIAELSIGTLRHENRPKSHWDFVLEEVAWLANDFAQERIWKITAAAQICHQVAFSSRLRIQEENLRWKTRELAHTLAKAVMEFWRSLQDTTKDLELQCPKRKGQHAVQSYAMRFLEYDSSNIQNSAPEAPLTPEKVYDFGVFDMSWDEDHLTEENLFYKIPSGATEVYRKSIESHLLHLEKIGSSMQEEAETSGFNDVTEFGSQENVFEEEDGETSSYYLPGAFEGSKSSKFAKKQRKNFPFRQIVENEVNGQPSVLIGKRAGNSLNVSFHTKRMRTASRPKVLNHFSGGTRVINKTDASSGDTDSFQDEQTNILEVNSVGDFEKKLTYDSYEVSNKPKKKKKAKHLNSTYEQRWQHDSDFHNEQRDHSKRKSENYHLGSNGGSGLFGQHLMKKPKMMRQSLDNNSFENLNPTAPVASQMSNMSNPNKIIKIINGRDRRKKTKQSKMPSGQLDSGNPWSQYEDQALVVLVHDMGPNWEFVSDALSSSLRFKRIFRKPKECKERHNFLMDRTGGDGADSAEDSGSSQPYPSTLPGIPKGSARQLFQRLHGPMEEDTLKSHFEKIIRIAKKRRARNENVEPKQLQLPHSSHTIALSQASPNNLGGGPILTPLDLCDISASSPDTLPVGYQIPQSSAGPVAPLLPTSDANLSVQCASSVVPSTSNSSIQSSPLNSPARYGIARSASLDEQQRMQQHYNQILPVRNLPRSPGLPAPVRILPGGLNRSVPLTRPGFQGVATSSSMLNSPSMISLPPGQGTSMPRPRHPLHKLRPSQNPELQKQQVQQGNIPLNGLSSSFTNQAAPPVQSYPALRAMTPQRPHLLNNPHIQRPISTHHQAYAVRFAKERQQQQQRLLQLSAPNGVMPPVQQSQPRPQNSPQIQSQNSSPPLPFSPPQKQLMPPGRNPPAGGSGSPSQMGKQRQRQQFPPAGRQHPQHSPAQQNPLSDSSLPPPHHLQKQHQLNSYQENPTAQRLVQQPNKPQPKEAVGLTKDPPLANSVSQGQSTGSMTDTGPDNQQKKNLYVGPTSPRTE